MDYIKTTQNMSSTENAGYLGLFIGPMYSGKTSKLIELYKQFKFCGVYTIVINYSEDIRYSKHMLSTHDMNMIPCIMVSTLSEVADIIDEKPDDTNIKNVSVILINEGQFFKDIVEWVNKAVTVYKKCVSIIAFI